MKTIKGDLILKKNTEFKESIRVEGSIKCNGERRNLKVSGDIVAGNIDAWNIDARNIDARNIVARNIDARNIVAWNIDAGDIVAGNIDAWNIDARNIDARNIVARNIDAGNIICEKRTKKTNISKTRARIFIQNKSKLELKEW